MNNQKSSISNEEMKILLEKYPFLNYKSWWSIEPEVTQQNISECIKNNYYNYYNYWDGTGWENLWKNLYLKHLFKLYDSWDKEIQSKFHFTQVKEKFGKLRIYTSFHTSENLEHIAEALSGWTCQQCGKVSKDEHGHKMIWTTQHWLTHLCKECAKKYLLNNGVTANDLENELCKMQSIQTKPDGFMRATKDYNILTTYKDAVDGWYDIDKVEVIQLEK